MKPVDIVILGLVMLLIAICVNSLIKNRNACSGCSNGNCSACKAAVIARKVARREIAD